MNLFLAATLAALAPLAPAQGRLLWQWRYHAPAIEAAGTLATDDKPDAEGFYRVLAITGARNGVAVSALVPANEFVPGNAPYAVDNRIRTAAPQLTKSGIGFELADRHFANPFFHDGKYLEYLSVPPYVHGAGPEAPVAFEAKRCGPGRC